jgi:hypothetical protein
LGSLRFLSICFNSVESSFAAWVDPDDPATS